MLGIKMLFCKNPELLKTLVAELLQIRLDSIEEFVITNPEMPPESVGSKFCRLDINMTIDGKRVNLEIQVENEGNFPERTLFHWARMYAGALPSGHTYSQLPQTICISILNFKLFNCQEFHSEFRPLEVTRHILLSDKMILHFFELKKLPESLSAANLMELWLTLFKAETEEELAKIKELGVPVMNQAIDAYYSTTATEEFREMERLRAKARHDEAQALQNVEEREREKWQSVIADKDAELADKDAELAQLRSLLAEFGINK
jgi:predicted transposase/invertase (TIGR01784 family)